MSSIAMSAYRLGTAARAGELARKFLGTGTFRRAAPMSSTAEQKPQETAKESDLPQTVEDCHKAIEALATELAATKEAAKDYEDKYKRALADGENLRRRLTKQIEDAKQFAIQSFCKDLLEVADTLTIAAESVPEQELTNGSAGLRSMHDGVRLTAAQLSQVFARHGLTKVHPLKERFDPNLHEALFQQEVEGAEAGTVVAVSKVGYKLHDRCVRPALVGVAK